jgi:hypothetical protein
MQAEPGLRPMFARCHAVVMSHGRNVALFTLDTIKFAELLLPHCKFTQRLLNVPLSCRDLLF